MKSPKAQIHSIVIVLESIISALFNKSESEFSELKKQDRRGVVDLAGENLRMIWDEDSDGAYLTLDTEKYDGILRDFILSFHYENRDDDAPYDLFIGSVLGETATIEALDAALDHLRGLCVPDVVTIVNLTPHAVNIMPDGPDGEVTSIPSSGEARATTTREHYGTINGIQIYRTKFGAVQGLPGPKKDTIYIVSSITAQAVPQRTDVYIPDDIVRDEQGRVIGCRALGRL